MNLGFIFSLPRAGSTYTLRVLSAGKGIRTSSEPWLMPALLGIRSGRQPFAEFHYDHVRIGLDALLTETGAGEEAWREGVRAMATTLYSHLAGPDDTFIDKTPRNSLFTREIIETFPDAPCLFLWRNPLSVIHSMNETWGKGRWKAYFYEIDLLDGLKHMVDTYALVRDRPNVLAVRYEDLVADPDAAWPKIFAHFGSEFDPAYAKNPPRLNVRMGDQSGQKKYAQTSAASVASWLEGIDTPIRKGWVRRYLHELGAERLATMGYELDELLAQLSEAKQHFRASDIPLIWLSRAYHKCSPFVWSARRKARADRSFSLR